MVYFEQNAAVAVHYQLPPHMKFWHAVCGLYIWEFITTLDYEWSIIRGRRPYRWTIWVYSLTRVSGLIAIILLIVCMDKVSPSICKVLPLTHYITAYLGFAAASLLIVLRIVAIWNQNKVVVRIAIGLWIINVAFLIQGAIRLRFAWSTNLNRCVVQSVQSFQLALMVALITNIILLLIVVVGLLRLRSPGGGSFGLQRMLWNQGIIWLVLAILAEVPPAVFILDMNKAVNLTFQIPSPILMSIVASRLHRGLTVYATEGTEIMSSGFRKNFPIIKTNQTPGPVAQVNLNPMEVTMHAAVERYPTSESKLESGQLGSDTEIDEQQDDKTKSIGLVINHDSDLESGLAK